MREKLGRKHSSGESANSIEKDFHSARRALELSIKKSSEPISGFQFREKVEVSFFDSLAIRGC
jgi:hypothetical protein